MWYILKMCWSLVWDCSSKCTHPYSDHPENVLISSVRLFLKMYWYLQCDTSWKCADPLWDCSSKCTDPYSVIHPENVLISTVWNLSSVRLFLKMYSSLQWCILKMCWSLVWDCSSKCTDTYSVIYPENVLISSVRLFLKMYWSLQCDTSWKCADL